MTKENKTKEVNMTKVKVLFPFNDIHTKKLYEVGTILEITKDRFEEINKNGKKNNLILVEKLTVKEEQ
jgi:hypothetical protein